MTPRQLVRAVSFAVGLPEETVFSHDRNLVAAGLRTTGARGVNAPDMTPLDAARLLVAVLGSVRVKDSALTVWGFEETKYLPPRESDLLLLQSIITKGDKDALKLFSDETIAALPADHSFTQALEALITRASDPLENLDDFRERLAGMKISCEAPSMQGEIARTGDISSAKYFYPLPNGEPRTYSHMYGITQARTTRGRAIEVLGAAFRNNGLLPFETTEEAKELLGSKKTPAKSKKKKGA